MLKRVFALLALASFGWSGEAPVSHAPDSYRYANQLLPAVVTLAEHIARVGALERRAPQYIALSTGKDEYVYQLKDKVFIRRIKDRYETPAWRICGDFAVVRVELMDEDMRTLPPIMSWFMIYRDGAWQKLTRDDEGRFQRTSYSAAELPPYAIHCFEKTSKND